jgi:hypothetical protein
MSASEARTRANQQNAARSTGPRTAEGKEKSRANSFKHGMTGEGVVLSNEDAAEVERRLAAFESELKPSGEVGRALVRRAALLSVRMDRGVSQESASLSRRVRQAEADFVAPDGLNPDAIAQLRAEAGREAMFDPSKEACLARKYEAAAERGFFRALKELRLLQKQSMDAVYGPSDLKCPKALGSFEQWEKEDAEFDAMYPEEALNLPSEAPSQFEPASLPPVGGSDYVPFTIGRRR